MAFKGTDNLPKPEDVLRCKFGGTNNKRSTGGCGKHVEKLGQMVRSTRTGDSWHTWLHLDYCKDHRYYEDGYYQKQVDHAIKGLEV
jgi:hypothetical protein